MRPFVIFHFVLLGCVPALGDDDATSGDDDSNVVDDDSTGDDDTSTDDDSTSSGDDDTPVADLFWFRTCGDVVCSGWTPSGAPLCDATQTLGALCAVADQTCDLQDDCNVQLICAETDPQKENPCPISRAAWKDQIQPLTGPEKEHLAQQALTVPLSSWHYAIPGPPEGRHVGFMLEDLPQGSPAVRGDTVDLYGLATLSLAAIQQQQQEIDGLRAEVEALRLRCGEGQGTGDSAATATRR